LFTNRRRDATIFVFSPSFPFSPRAKYRQKKYYNRLANMNGP